MRKAVMTKITTWGNSFGLRLPKDFVYSTNIDLERPLEISLKSGRSFLVKEVNGKGVGLTKDYFVRAFKKAKPLMCGEFDWGRPKGREMW